MGDDLLDLNAASQRQVRFLSPSDFRGRTLSGASQDLSDNSRPATPEANDVIFMFILGHSQL